MNDYTWPSVYFAYFFFAICLVLALFFFFRSLKDGYWSKESEAIRYQVFEEAPDVRPLADARGSEQSHDWRDQQEVTHGNR